MDVEQITDWLWCLRTPVQAYAVRHSDGFHLIDTSTAGREGAILDALGSVAGSAGRDVAIRDVLLTHGHDDHTGSAAALAERSGARILGPTGDASVIEGDRAAPVPTLRDWEVALYEQTLEHVAPAPPVRIDVLVDDGAILDWEVPGRIVAAPGHTPGSVAVLFEDAGVLVAGDAIASHEDTPMVGVFNADLPQAVATFRQLATLDVDIACFGHGAPLVGDAGARLQQVAASL
jgi:glyoxylase-like metal-dependent hydrolase (beta-lactamase superfamily II)